MGGDDQATHITKELIQLDLSVTCPRDHLFLRKVYCKSDFNEVMYFCFPDLSPTCDMQSTAMQFTKRLFSRINQEMLLFAISPFYSLSKQIFFNSLGFTLSLRLSRPPVVVLQIFLSGQCFHFLLSLLLHHGWSSIFRVCISWRLSFYFL